MDKKTQISANDFDLSKYLQISNTEKEKESVGSTLTSSDALYLLKCQVIFSNQYFLIRK